MRNKAEQCFFCKVKCTGREQNKKMWYTNLCFHPWFFQLKSVHQRLVFPTLWLTEKWVYSVFLALISMTRLLLRILRVQFL